MTNSAQPGEFVRFGAFQVDLPSGELRKNGVKIRLPDQSFQILVMLTKSPRKVVTREELRNKLWPTDTFVDFDSGLNSAILRLRNALGDSAEHPRYIETLPRRGYRFIAEVNGDASKVAEAGALTDSIEAGEIARALGSQAVAAAEASPVPSLRRVGKFRLAVAVGSTAAALILGLYFSRERPFGTNAAARIQSLAVLPLENLTGDPSQEYFADGMTDALITDLAQIRSLRVISRTSAMRYKGVKKTLPEIARELGVDAVVEGTVVRGGDRVRIDAQLIQAKTERHLWAKSYERDMRDVVALQGDVAQAIAKEIQIQVTPQERALLAVSRPVNTAAYEDYLRGRFFWNKRTEAGTKKSIEYFELALQKDPHYAPALSGMADAYNLLGFYGGVPPQQAYPRAKAAATEALKLDDSLAEAHVSLAGTKIWFDWDWSGGEAELKRAIELKPNYETAYRAYSNYLAGMGRAEEAIAAARKAHDLDPLSATLSTHVGSTLFLTGHEDLAIEQFRKTLEMDPYYAWAHRDLAVALAYKGQSAEAIREARKSIELSEANPIMLEALGYAYARAGQRREFQKILRQLQEQRASRYVSPFYEAVLYAAADQNDAAFKALESAYHERSSQLFWLNAYPMLDTLRSDTRFAELVSRVGLPKTHPKPASGP
jgi:TolB-like protein/DNA-binding winged helix-turn-helix (wHTH) protein/Flp pilus assembly protein TadD